MGTKQRSAAILAAALAAACLQAASQAGPGPLGVATLSANPGESDYPAACAAPDGTVWAVWLAYSGGSDRLFAARWNGAGWSAPVVGPPKGNLYKPACGVDKRGRLWAVWSQQTGSDWDLWSSAWDGKTWAPTRPVVTRAGTDLAPRIAAAPDATLFLVWQAWTGRSFDILLSTLDGDRWRAPETVSENAANDWHPAISAAAGTVTVVWDSYRNGDYDVFLRQRKGGAWGPEITVAASGRFEGNASVAMAPDGAVWIAYEERTERWGKDRGNGLPLEWDELDTLLGPGRVRVRCYRQGRLLDPPQPPKQTIAPYEYGGDHSPAISAGRDGRIWLAFRRPVVDQPGWNGRPIEGARPGDMRRAEGSSHMVPLGVGWHNYASRLGAGGWSEPVSFGDTGSRVDSDLRTMPLPDGRLLGVWHSDNRKQVQKPRIFSIPSVNGVYANAIPAPEEPATAAVLAPADAGTPQYAPDVARERRDLAMVRGHLLQVGGQTYKVYRGDLHRHTDISWDGSCDSSLTDMFRYAMDAAALDFIAPTDHNQLPMGVDVEWVWWRTQKITDVFHCPPRFVALFGYERGLGYPFGHRNVIEAKAGFRTFPRTEDPSARGGIAKDDTRQLYEYVRKTGGIIIPHQLGMHHTWQDNDPAVEPVVEIYQGCRNSYEYEGAPRADSRTRPRQAYAPEGFLWNAWKKGYRLGVIASSDHQSTHISFAGVYASEFTREGILEAIRKRHTFGSTDNIVLEFRSGARMAGDEFTAPSPEPFQITVKGSAPIAELVIVKNYRFVYVTRSQETSLSLQWRDAEPAKGENMYYVRAMQTDGQLAWSSPIWVALR
jgi:hypothetical protein